MDRDVKQPLPCDSNTAARILVQIIRCPALPLAHRRNPAGWVFPRWGWSETSICRHCSPKESAPALCGLWAGEEEGYKSELEASPPFPEPAHKGSAADCRAEVPRGCQAQSPPFVSLGDRAVLLWCCCYYCRHHSPGHTWQMAALLKKVVRWD